VKRKFITGNLPFTCAAKKMLLTVLMSVLILHLVYCIYTRKHAGLFQLKFGFKQPSIV